MNPLLKSDSHAENDALIARSRWWRSLALGMGSMITVALFGLFSAGIFLAHAVDAYHAQ
jgi:hypothetical protein